MLSNLDKTHGSVNLNEAQKLEEAIDETRNRLRKKHLKSIEKQEYNYKSGLIYNNLFSGLEKVGDYLISISEYVSGENLN